MPESKSKPGYFFPKLVDGLPVDEPATKPAAAKKDEKKDETAPADKD